MKKIILLFLTIIAFSVLLFSVTAAENSEAIFLLGKNGKMDIILPGEKAITQNLGKNPVCLLTGNNGRKLVLCGGEADKNLNIKEGASLILIGQDCKTIDKTIQYESPLAGFEVNQEKTVLWLATSGGLSGKETVQPKLYRIDLVELTASEIILDSTPCELTVSHDQTQIAVATLGAAPEKSQVTLYDSETLTEITRCEAAQNPGLVQFSEDDSNLLIAGYGYQPDFDFPINFFLKSNQPVPAGYGAYSPTGEPVTQITELGMIAQVFIPGKEVQYAITKDGNGSKVRAFGFTGTVFETKLDYLPKWLQERPGAEQVFVFGGKRVTVLNGKSGEVLKDLTLDSEAKPILFLEGNPYAYLYNAGTRKLYPINLEKLELGKATSIGSTGIAVLRVVAMVGSFIEFQNSLTPMYAGGVRVPRAVTPIYWVNTPKGNILEGPNKKLYLLSSMTFDVVTYDPGQGKILKKLGRMGQSPQYLILSPNQKYIIVASGDEWKLINTTTDKVDLSVNVEAFFSIRLAGSEKKVPTPYFNPAGDKLYLQSGVTVLVVDLENGEKLPNLETKTRDAMICW